MREIVKIAVQGCSHGEFSKIYEDLEALEIKTGKKVDLLICCGDFQAVRNLRDLTCMAVPQKFKKLGDFPDYYFGKKLAPVLTIFIGGNHESSNHLWELPYGGWVCPNIYYLGYSNSIIFNNLRICGISGIYKHYNHKSNHFETPPFDEHTVRSIYHSRNVDCFSLGLLKNNKVDIFLSHDWPLYMYNYGDVDTLLRYKKHFKSDIENDYLGDPHKFELLKLLKPDRWFSAHLHTFYIAKIPHEDSENFTLFTALDKALPRRKHIQIYTFTVDKPNEAVSNEDKLSVESCRPSSLCYDPVWLAILRKTYELTNCYGPKTYPVLPSDVSPYIPTEKDLNEVSEIFGGNFKVPENFRIVAEADEPDSNYDLSDIYPLLNQQTDDFCQKLLIPNPCKYQSADVTDDKSCNPDEIDISI